MRKTTNDKTLERNFIQKFQFLIKEYELIKAKKHSRYRFVSDFYRVHETNRQTFLKYYNRFNRSGKITDLLPGKRGPKWKTRRPIPFIENKVVELREKGNNKYEIHNILKPKLGKFTPSPSGIYNILKRKGLNKLTLKIKENKRKIIKKKAGELGHIDCHYLPKGILKNSNERLFLVCIIDSCTRIAWVEVIKDIKSITVMFAALKSLNILSEHFGIKFSEMLSDNGSEFGVRGEKNKDQHPFERMLMELGIKHRYTKPYRPQTNGKVERFWRTIEEDLLAETCFDSFKDLQEEVLQYVWYYNYERPHQALNGICPKKFLENLSAN